MERFLIAPYDTDSGLQTNVKPWLVPDAAFTRLQNAYVYRGRVRKRFGSRWLGNTQLTTRFRVKIGTVPGGGNFAGFVPRTAATVPIVTPAIGQMFSIGTQVFTVYQLGVNADMYISGTATLATFDTTAVAGGGAVTINGVAVGTDVYYYPALPVMGLITKEQPETNEEKIFGFDTRFAYEYVVGGWERLATEADVGAARWSGSDAQFFWGTTFSGVNAQDLDLYVTNFNDGEPNFMRRYNTATGWHNFHPVVNNATGATMTSARILVPFKGHLVALNTYEAGVNYRNRMRWSWVGDPTGIAPAADAWKDDLPGCGGGEDAATSQAILSAAFVKDSLIVYFERSTWEVKYTGDLTWPFEWQQLNSELGVESTFSITSFDKFAMGIGNVGVHACNSFNVERIDSKIPDLVFSIHNIDQGTARVYAIRDYRNEMVYWTIPTPLNVATFPYPKAVLVYNYKNGTWALNDDSITCFGYFQNINPTGITWDSTVVTWDSQETWGSGAWQAQHRDVIAGNQEGYTFLIDANEPTNSSNIQVTNIAIAVGNVITITAINHNFGDGDYVYLENIVGTGNLNLLNGQIFKIDNPPTQHTFQIIYDDPAVVIAGNYQGNGVISSVSQIAIDTKEFNFYAKQGLNAIINKVDFFVDRTMYGKMFVKYYISSCLTDMAQSGVNNGVSTGDGMLETSNTNYLAFYPYELTAERVWRPVYFDAEGETIKLSLTMTEDLMLDPQVRISKFEMHAMVFNARPAGRLQ